MTTTISVLYLTTGVDKHILYDRLPPLARFIRDIFDGWSIEIDDEVYYSDESSLLLSTMLPQSGVVRNTFMTRSLIESAMRRHLSERMNAHHITDKISLSVSDTDDIPLPYKVEFYDDIGSTILYGKLGKLSHGYSLH